MILVPGEHFAFTYTGSDLAQYTSVLKEKDAEPMLRIESDIKFSGIERGKKYQYIAIHNIPFSCNEKVSVQKYDNYGFISFRAVKEDCIATP